MRPDATWSYLHTTSDAGTTSRRNPGGYAVTLETLQALQVWIRARLHTLDTRPA